MNIQKSIKNMQIMFFFLSIVYKDNTMNLKRLNQSCKKKNYVRLLLEIKIYSLPEINVNYFNYLLIENCNIYFKTDRDDDIYK